MKGCLKLLMLDTIIQILDRHIENYAIVPEEDGTSSIVFFLPYKPYKEDEQGVFIDAYYKASNELYHIGERILKELNDAGIEASREKRNIYKKTAVKSGLVSYTRTSLTAHEKYGTRIALGVISVKGAYQLLRRSRDLCLNCGKCIQACPNNALTNDGLVREKCLRELQNMNREWTEDEAVRMGGRIFGCDTCQAVCPVNKEQGIADKDKAISAFADTACLIEKACKGKKALEELIPYIGINYLKPKRILTMALNAACNMDDFRCIDIAKGLLEDSDIHLRRAAARLTEKYKKQQNIH